MCCSKFNWTIITTIVIVAAVIGWRKISSSSFICALAAAPFSLGQLQSFSNVTTETRVDNLLNVTQSLKHTLDLGQLNECSEPQCTRAVRNGNYRNNNKIKVRKVIFKKRFATKLSPHLELPMSVMFIVFESRVYFYSVFGRFLSLCFFH